MNNNEIVVKVKLIEGLNNIEYTFYNVIKIQESTINCLLLNHVAFLNIVINNQVSWLK